MKNTMLMLLWLSLFISGCQAVHSESDTPAIARLRAIASTHHLKWAVSQDEGGFQMDCQWHVQVWDKSKDDRWFELSDEGAVSPDAAVDTMVQRIRKGLPWPPDICISCQKPAGRKSKFCLKHDSRTWGN